MALAKARILAIIVLAGMLAACSPSAEEQVNKLIVEAQTSLKDIKTKPPGEALAAIDAAKATIQKIVDEFPETDIAVQLASGMGVGKFSTSALDDMALQLTQQISSQHTGLPFRDEYAAVAALGDDILVAGMTRDIKDPTDEGWNSADAWVRRLDQYGTVKWELDLDEGNFERLNEIAVLSDGSIVASGLVEGPPFATLIYQIAADGSSSKRIQPKDIRYTVGSAPNQAGGIVTIGTNETNTPSATLHWLNMDGTSSRQVALPEFGGNPKLAVLSNGSVVIAAAGQTDPKVILVPLEGKPRYILTNIGSGEFRNLAATKDGGFVVMGGQYVDYDKNMPWIGKYDGAGAPVWESSFPNYEHATFTAATEVESGNVVVATQYGRYGPGLKALLVEIDTTGEVVASRTYGTMPLEFIQAADTKDDGTIIFAGRTEQVSSADSGDDGWLLIAPVLQ